MGRPSGRRPATAFRTADRTGIDMEGPAGLMLWSLIAAFRAGASSLDAMAGLLTTAAHFPCSETEAVWTTPQTVVLDLPVLTARQFGRPGGRPVVVVTPHALHGANVADLAPGHSLVGRLISEGLEPLVLVEWKSAGPSMRFLGIEDYLAQLAILIDDLGPPCSVIGLCQGGWLSVMLAARFPNKVSGLVLAGAPIDLDAAASAISVAARRTSPALVDMVIQDGLVRGQALQAAFGMHHLESCDLRDVLQIENPAPEVVERFRVWQARVLDLPGRYYEQVVEDLFRHNALVKGEFRALGRRLDLRSVRSPTLLIASDGDEVTAPGQVFSIGRLLGTPIEFLATSIAKGPHLSLFMGRRTLNTVWRNAARWVRETSGTGSHVSSAAAATDSERDDTK